MILKYLINKKEQEKNRALICNQLKNSIKFNQVFKNYQIRYSKINRLTRQKFQNIFRQKFFTLFQREILITNPFIQDPTANSQYYALIQPLSIPHYLTNATQIPGTKLLSNNLSDLPRPLESFLGTSFTIFLPTFP